MHRHSGECLGCLKKTEFKENFQNMFEKGRANTDIEVAKAFVNGQSYIESRRQVDFFCKYGDKWLVVCQKNGRIFWSY